MNYGVGREKSQYEVSVSWEFPPEGWIALNIIGASWGNPGPTGGDGVLRGSRGEWLTGFAQGLRHCTSMKAEIKAVPEGLQLAKDIHVVGPTRLPNGCGHAQR